MKRILLFALCIINILYAGYITTDVSGINKIDNLRRVRNGFWIKVRGQIISSKDNRITIRDTSGTVDAYFVLGENIPRLQRYDTVTVAGIVYRPAKIPQLKIMYLEKDGEALFERVIHEYLEIPKEYDQSSLNRVISSQDLHLRRRAITCSSIASALHLLPIIAVIPAVSGSDIDGGGKFGLFLIAMMAEFAVTPLTVPLYVVSIKSSKKRRRLPPLVLLDDEPEYEEIEVNPKEIELELYLQMKPVHNGGGLFLVGNF